ncbi:MULTISPECIES: acyltransferase [unclassified Ruegeria]|uniref:acyltransferase family protein n=1 Tax=unclassified Ruegeria TaxID=2625375 RepID=UPI001488537F|nr:MULTISPECIES: acyltransferase [unclassified Ruegeria]NOD65596.1 acyltransferase family protein [Ruegeria sp. HKCCD6109]
MINNIQALRAFAAINVVFLHVLKTATNYQQDAGFLSFLSGWGANGVDIFFVISGFVMLHTQMQRRRGIGDFLKSRIIRIVPIYWLITAFVVVLYFALPGLFRSLEVTPASISWSLLFISKLMTGESPIVYVGWTLEWEMFFYLIFGLSLAIGIWKYTLVTVGVILLVTSFMAWDFISLEFLFGMGIAYLFNTGYRVSNTTGIAIFAIGFALLCLSLVDSEAVTQVNRAVIWGIPSALIVFGLISVGQTSNAFAIYLGDASYSIYLIQILSIPAFYKASSIVLGSANGDVIALLCLVASVFAGCLMYSFIEKPITTKLRTTLSGARMARQ